jgi:hypothetical protein
MPGTGHSSRYKGSISNRNSKPAFQVLAPWNSKKNGDVNQVPVSSGGGPINFKLVNAKMMSNYNKNTDEFTFDCSLNVLGNKVISGTTTYSGKVICKDDVDIYGNLTIDGVLSAQTALIQDLSAINITDVCDNVLTLGNHESISTQHMRGVFMSYIGNTFNDEFSFMGFDPCGNECLGGPVNDTHGQFVFLTDASFNSQAPAAECNITGDPGRVLVGTLDISGTQRYGNGVGVTGLPTQNVTGQANSSMHLVGRTIIAQEGTNSAQLDISGGINVVGSSKLTDLSGAYIDISGGNVDIDSSAAPGGDIRIITNTGTDQKIVIDNKQGAASDSVSIKSEAGGIDIIGGTSVKLSDGSGAYIDISGGKVDISGDDVSITGSSSSSLNLKGQQINIGQTGSTVDLSGTVNAIGTISASTISTDDIEGVAIDISGTTSVQMSASGTQTFSQDHPYIRVGTGSNQYDLGVEIGKAKTVKISGNGSVNLINPLPASGPPYTLSWGQSANGNSGPCGRIQLNFTPARTLSAASSIPLTLNNNAIMEDSIILLTICGSTAGKSVDLLPSVESQSSGAQPGLGGQATFQIKNTGSTTVQFSAGEQLWLNYLIINPASYI